MTGQAYALAGLVLTAAACTGAFGFALGRLSARPRHARGMGESRSEAMLAMALEDGLATLKAQQAAMRERAAASERLNTQIVDSLTAGLLLVDREGRVELLNPAGRRLLGLEALSPGSACEDVLRTAPALAAVIAEARAGHLAISRRTVTVEGASTQHFGVTVSPLGGGRDGGVICLFSDLTSIVEMEGQLRLKEALARLGELTAGLAHEFRNGLATIHGYGRLLDPEVLPAPCRPYVEGIRRETEQLGRVVTNFLNFARPEQMVLVPVSLDTVVRRAAADVPVELAPAPASAIVVEGHFGTVEGDEQLLKQAFDNLFRNAMEACVAAGVSPAIVVRGTVDPSQGLVRVTVDDNGPGIPEAERDRVFRPFFTTRAAGTGLGLAIVQKIVLAHNGNVSVLRSPQGGARLDMLLPLSASVPAAAA